jgi:pimeloyl-ACP methyl ester carboxylesterase
MAPHPTALHVEATGPEDAPAIVFVHGIGAAGWMWWRRPPWWSPAAGSQT